MLIIIKDVASVFKSILARRLPGGQADERAQLWRIPMSADITGAPKIRILRLLMRRAGRGGTGRASETAFFRAGREYRPTRARSILYRKKIFLFCQYYPKLYRKICATKPLDKIRGGGGYNKKYHGGICQKRFFLAVRRRGKTRAHPLFVVYIEQIHGKRGIIFYLLLVRNTCNNDLFCYNIR